MKNRELLKNKISIGLSLEMSLEEYEKIFEKYHGYIKSIYFSPPLGDIYHSRNLISEQFENPDIVKKFNKILELARKYNIKLDCVLNTPNLPEQKVIESFPTLKSYDLDQITCLNEHAEIISKEFPEQELIYSYNNDFKMKKLENVSKSFSTIVVGKYFLRIPHYLEAIHDNGFEVKLLVNNGCSYNCMGCGKGTRNCSRTFEHNLKNMSAEELYAMQSFYPYELNELLSKLSYEPESIKISNRTDGYEYLNMCLDSYINEIPPEEYISMNPRNYRLYNRLGCFSGLLENIDKEHVMQYKKRGFKF